VPKFINFTELGAWIGPELLVIAEFDSTATINGLLFMILDMLSSKMLNPVKPFLPEDLQSCLLPFTFSTLSFYQNIIAWENTNPCVYQTNDTQPKVPQGHVRNIKGYARYFKLLIINISAIDDFVRRYVSKKSWKPLFFLILWCVIWG
jgi:hypothetical protein